MEYEKDLYRAKKNGDWVYGFLLPYAPIGAYYICNFDSAGDLKCNTCEQSTIQRFSYCTNFKLQRIFEGDIIYEETSGEHYVVEFVCGKFIASYFNGSEFTFWCDLMVILGCSYVVGNTIDNKELLETMKIECKTRGIISNKGGE